jgi:hypothetical protein
VTEKLTDEEAAALAAAFATPVVASQLLERAGLARSHQPAWAAGQSSLEFWQEVNDRLGNGVLPDGRTRVLAEAARVYRRNAVFRRGGAPPGGSAPVTASGGRPGPRRRVAGRRWLLPAGVTVLLIAVALVTLWRAADGQRSEKPTAPSPSGGPSLPGRPPASTGPPAGTFVVGDTPTALPAGDVTFQVAAPSALRATAVGGQLCDFSLLSAPAGGLRRYLVGTDILAHVPRGGRFEIHTPHSCSIIVVARESPPSPLPIVVTPTAQGGDSPVFIARRPFTVTMSPGEVCGATLFRASDGAQVGHGIGAGSTVGFDPGTFWVSTRTRGCTLSIREPSTP